MSWNRVAEKFHWLSEVFADSDLRNRLVRAVEQIDAAPIPELTQLLGLVHPAPVFTAIHAGIQ